MKPYIYFKKLQPSRTVIYKGQFCHPFRISDGCAPSSKVGRFLSLADSQDKASASGQCPWYQHDGARRQKTPSAKDVCHLLSSSPCITQAPKDTLHTLVPGAGYATQQQHIRTLADCGIKEKVALPTTPKKAFLNTFLHC